MSTVNNVKNEIDEINKALWLLKIEIKKTAELLELLRDYIHEDSILII